jgi:hypothetical protein
MEQMAALAPLMNTIKAADLCTALQNTLQTCHLKIIMSNLTADQPGSSVSIVSMYCTTRLQFLTGAEDFSSNLCAKSSYGAHPASYTMGTGASSPGVKHGQGMMLTTCPLLTVWLRKSRCYTSCHPKCLHGM